MKNPFELISTDPVEANMLSLKSKLIIILTKLIRDQGWSQCVAAEKLGVSQPRISSLMNGQLSKFSIDTLLKLILKVGYELDMNFTPLNTRSPLAIAVKGDDISYK